MFKIILLSHKALEELKMEPEYIYGTIKGKGGCYRLNTKTKKCEFVLWKAGEQGHKVDCWHEMGVGWEESFIAGYPLEVEKSNRLEF